MQIELLHDFIVLSEELNFRSAAKALFTTPSTLSKHIATLGQAFRLPIKALCCSRVRKKYGMRTSKRLNWSNTIKMLQRCILAARLTTLRITRSCLGSSQNSKLLREISRTCSHRKASSLKNKFPFWNQATPIALCSMWLKAFFARYMQMLRSSFTRWAGRVLMRWCLKAARLRTKRFWSFAISRGKISFSWLVPALRPRGCKSRISLMTPGFITPLRCFRLQHPMTILTLTPKGTCFCCLSFTMRQNATNRAAACAFLLMGKR